MVSFALVFPKDLGTEGPFPLSGRGATGGDSVINDDGQELFLSYVTCLSL